MKPRFREPVFASGSLEFRVEGKEVCIYGNDEGLLRLAEFCKELVAGKTSAHLHLEDYSLLTSESLIGTIAVFKDAGPPGRMHP